MRLWLDDVRPMPKGYDMHVKTVEEAQELLETYEITAISFDHDLGVEKTGYDLAKWIEAMAHSAGLPPLEWAVHSANPVGVKNIEAAMKMADRYWTAVRVTFMRKDYWKDIVEWHGSEKNAEEWMWHFDNELNTVLSPAGIILMMLDHPQAPEESDLKKYVKKKLEQKQDEDLRRSHK